MKLTSLGLHITDQCNARCLHCSFSCGPQAKGNMRLTEAVHYLRDAGTLDAQVVCITGGEPMLYPSLVKKLVSLSRRASIAEIWLFTNSFWAHTTQQAHSTVKDLRNLGLTKISTSIDFFHQHYIPIEHLKNAIQAAIEYGLDVCVDARFIGDTNEKNRFNSATHRYLGSMRNLLSNVEVIKAQPLFVGRAAESLTKYVRLRPLSEILDEKCPGAWAGGTLASPAGVDVDQNGAVTLCPGLSIGNIRESSLRRLVEKYDYRNFAIISALYDSGMKGLMNLASENGFVPEPAYADGCHFCYEARKFLRTSYPETFVMLIDQKTTRWRRPQNAQFSLVAIPASRTRSMLSVSIAAFKHQLQSLPFEIAEQRFE